MSKLSNMLEGRKILFKVNDSYLGCYLNVATTDTHESKRVLSRESQE